MDRKLFLIRFISPKQELSGWLTVYQLHGHLTRPRLVPTHRWKYHYDRMRFHRLKGTAFHLGQALSLPCLGRVSMFLSDRIMAGCLYGSAHRNVSGWLYVFSCHRRIDSGHFEAAFFDTGLRGSSSEKCPHLIGQMRAKNVTIFVDIFADLRKI